MKYLSYILLASLVYLFACEDQNQTGNQSTSDLSMMGGGSTQQGGTVIEPQGGDSTVILIEDQMMTSNDQEIKIWDMGKLDQDPSTLPDVFMPPPLPAECNQMPVIGEQTPFATEARCQANGEDLKIRHLRDRRCSATALNAPSRQPGVDIELNEVVVTGIYGENKMSIQDLDGGVYSGMWLWNKDQTIQASIRVGSKLQVKGQVIEYYTLTEIISEEGDIVISGMAPLPNPIQVADTAKIATGGEWTEMLESVLVEINGAVVTNTEADCPVDYNMLILNNNLRLARLDDITYEPRRGDVLRKATGVVYFSHDQNKFYPRNLEDLDIIDCKGPVDKCDADVCTAQEDALESGKAIITEIQVNPSGYDDTREYVELFNPNNVELNINGWRLEDCGQKGVELRGVIPPRAYFVVASSMNRNENGGVDADASLLTANGGLSLPNDGGSVLIYDQNGTLVDQVRYLQGDGTNDWPVRADGESLELIVSGSDNRLGSNWGKGRRSYGEGGKGTPGSAY
jgi:hypothetical protein